MWGGDEGQEERIGEAIRKPLKDLLRPKSWDAFEIGEMARRLRRLDEEVRAVEEMERGHGGRHPHIFTERLRVILDGEE